MDDKEREVKVRYKMGENEFEGQGHPEDLNPHVALWASMVAPTTESGVIQLKLPEGVKADTPRLADHGVPRTDFSDQNGGSEVHYSDVSDVVPFYLKTERPQQAEQLMLITYFFTHHLGHDTVSMEDYKKAYDYLADVPVSKPANICARLGEMGRQIRKVQRGQYKLTHHGTSVVKKWLSGEE